MSEPESTTESLEERNRSRVGNRGNIATASPGFRYGFDIYRTAYGGARRFVLVRIQTPIIPSSWTREWIVCAISMRIPPAQGRKALPNEGWATRSMFSVADLEVLADAATAGFWIKCVEAGYIYPPPNTTGEGDLGASVTLAG
ncbi:hypothetical protein ColTof3_09746 [Colletotrichum tofieldiae]|nr:hypothetical protein ColTof3_09746 [Colletotrichum tofieldiae]